MSFRRFARRLDRALEIVLAVLMAAMVVVVLWQVFARFVLRAPSSTSEELVRFGLIWVGLLGAAYGFGKRQHLAIELVGERLSHRGKLTLDLFIQFWVAIFALVILLLGGSRLVEITLTLGQTSAAVQIKRGYIYLALPLSGAVVLFYASAAFAGRLRDLMHTGARPGRDEI